RRVARPPYGSVHAHHSRPRASTSGRTTSSGRPTAASGDVPSNRAAAALTSATTPSASATTTPSGRWSRPLATGSAPEGPRGRVQADRGGGREVEALGSAVERHADDGVGAGEGGRVEPVRLVAEQPRGRSRERAVVGGVVEVEVAGTVGGQHL